MTTVQEKYVRMYERFIEELKLYSRAIRVLSKGYLPISLLPPSKLEKILSEVRIAIAKSNKDYDLVLTRLYLYYDMKLVTFGIDNQSNLIVQFPVFIQPYTQKRLVMYQIETVPVPILDKNKQAHLKHIVLDGGFQIILANWPNYRKIMCSHNNNIPVNIPGHPYVLMNQSILCNCDIGAESNFLLESLAACEGPDAKTDLEMHFTVNLAFMNYFDDILENLGKQISLNWTTQEQILPISLETFEISQNLINAPKRL